MSINVKVFAVIPTFNRFERLKLTVENLSEQDIFHKTVVIDNCSSDETYKIKHFPLVHYIRLNENLGSAGGYKAGIKYSYDKSDFIFLSDDDILYEKGAVKKLLDFMTSNPAAGAARCSWEGYKGPIMEVESAGWAGVLIRSEIIYQVGLPIQDFFMYGEDIEFFLRMRKRGFRLYAIPDARYKFRERPKLYEDPFRFYYAFRNEMYVWKKYNRKRIIKLILHFLRILPKISQKSRLASFEGLVDGILGRIKKNEKYLPKSENKI